MRKILSCLLALSFLTFIAVLTIFPIEDPDIWFQLAQGRWIIEHNFHVPEIHPFSYAIPDVKSTTFEWASEIGIFKLYQALGIDSIIVINFIIIISTFLVLLLVAVRLEIPHIISIPILTIGVLASAERFLVRMEHIGNLFLVIELGILLVWRRKLYQLSSRAIRRLAESRGIFQRRNLPAGKAGIPPLIHYLGIGRNDIIRTFLDQIINYQLPIFIMPLIFLLWINMHGSFALGLVILVAFLISEVLSRKRPIKPLLIITLLSFLALVSHPQRDEVINLALTIAGFNKETTLFLSKLYEFQSPFSAIHSGQIYVFFFKILLFVYWGSFIIGLVKEKSSWFGFFCLLIGTYLGLTHVRYVNIFVLLGFLGAVEGLRNFKFQISNFKFSNKKLKIINYGIYLLLLLVFIFSSYHILNNGYKLGTTYRRFGLGVKPILPSGAIEFLDRNKVSGNLLNQYEIGAYLTFCCHPSRPVFIDGLGAYPEWFFKEYLSMSESPEKTSEILDKYKIDYVLTLYPENNSGKSVPDYLSIDQRFALVYWDNYYLLFLRRQEKFANIIEPTGYRFADPLKLGRNAFIGRLLQAEGPILREKIIDELKRNLSENPQNARAHLYLGSMLEGTGDFDGALNEYVQAIKFNPENLLPNLLISGILVKREQFETAQEILQKALKKNPNLPSAYLILGQIEEKDKNYKKAESYFKKALNLEPGLAHAYLRLGIIYSFNLYDSSLARKNLLRALELGLPDDQARLAREALSAL